MQKIKKLHHSTFTGEESLRDMRYVQGKWVKNYARIVSSIGGKTGNGKAVVLGNGVSRTELSPELFNLLEHHSDFTTYGCNAISRDFKPDFVCVNDELEAEFVEKKYYLDTVCYGTAKMFAKHPEKFYAIPQDPNWNMGAIAAYLACFDGHKTVYLLGHDLFSGEHNYQMNVYSGTPGYPDTYDLTTEGYFERSLLQVMQTYDDVDFVRVVPSNTHYMPESWKYLLNLRQLTFREFVIETDLG